MYSKALIICSSSGHIILKSVILLLAAFVLFFQGCSTLDFKSQSTERDNNETISLKNSPNVPATVAASDRIKSVELYRIQRGNVPAITLGSTERLTLRFDEIADETNIFRVKLTHHNADWEESTVIPAFFLRGYQEDTISGGTPSVIGDPSYFSYSYEFPNKDFGVRISGNYMVHLLDYNTGERLFSLPFIVMEDRGALSIAIEDIYDFRAIPHHQIFATYRFPDFILMPQTELSIYFVQNQNWGRYIRATEMDASRQGEIRMHQPRDNSFFARYEFRPLLIDDVRSVSRDILEVFPEKRPPLIRLQYDIVDLDINPRLSRSYRFGQPVGSRSARYINVEFNLERPGRIARDAEVYVLGPFTNWQIQPEFRMEYIPEEDAFRTISLIKEGRYDYTYAVIENGYVNDLRLDAFFADTRQYYQVIVYFHDREQGYDRVLQFANTRSR